MPGQWPSIPKWTTNIEGLKRFFLSSAQNVIGPTGQAVVRQPPDPAKAFGELIAMIRSGNAYVNVHSSAAPGGDVRGQVEPGTGSEDD